MKNLRLYKPSFVVTKSYGHELPVNDRILCDRTAKKFPTSEFNSANAYFRRSLVNERRGYQGENFNRNTINLARTWFYRSFAGMPVSL